MPFVEDIITGKPTNLHYYQTGYQSQDVTLGQWNVESIQRHRRTADGKLQFLTRWEGEDPSNASWEPVESFVEQSCYELVKYCRAHKLKIDLMEYLRDTPSTE